MIELSLPRARALRAMQLATLLASSTIGLAGAAPPTSSATATTSPSPTSTTPLPSWAMPPEPVLAPPTDATLAPDGLRAAWVSADRRSVLSATRASAAGGWTAAARLLTTRGTVGKLAFSPDGRSIAYENPRTWRGDGTPDDRWSYIGVYDLATRQISHVDPQFDVDTDPVWSADGTHITFTRHVDGLPDRTLTRPVIRLQLAAWQEPPRHPIEPFTLASVLAAPHIYPPAPSGDGRSLAYLTREARSRRVYFMRVGGAARQLVDYAEDYGRDLSDVAVSRAGGAVAYVRGDSPNRQGDSPNPTSLADPPQQDVWLVGTDGDVPRLLGAGRDPMFTPDDRSVLWRARGSVWAADLVWSRGRLAGVGAPREFLTGAHAGLRFSPDGTQIAYERAGGIEIRDLATDIAVAVPHGKDLDAGPVWSPDGRRLVFRREPADSPGLLRNVCGRGLTWCGPMVAAQPWALWVVDVAELQPRRIWQAAPGVGSVYYALDQRYAPGMHGDQYFWSADDRIAFVWEQDGWRHLYAVPAAGGEAVRLTPGDGEVESAAITPERVAIVYASNIGDLGRRHLSRVELRGTASPTALTSGDTSQWAPVPLAAGRVAYVGAGWSDPPRVLVRERSGRVSAAALPKAPAGFPARLLVKPELVEFPAADGHTAYGQLFVPAQPNGCAIVFAHGGIRRQMLPGYHYMDVYAHLHELNQYLAGRGCVVLSVEYRSSIMRGEAYRNAPGWGFAANSEMRDFVGAANWLQARSDVDATRGVGIYGLSWGGYVTAEALAMHSDLYTVGFDMAGVHTTADPAGYPNSAVARLATWKSPVYLVQGDDDMNVDFNDGIVLARALQRQRPDLEFVLESMPGQTHDLYQTFEQLVGIYGRGAEFMLQKLGAGIAETPRPR